MRNLSVLACLLVAGFAAPVRAGEVQLLVSPDTLRADSTGIWHADVSMRNGGSLGLYADSLFLEQLSLDPDSSRTPRRSVRSLQNLLHIMLPAGAGEGSGFEWTAPAEFTRGVLWFRLHAHDAQKKTFVLETPIAVEGSDLADATPSRVIGTPGTEIIVLEPSARPAPAVVAVLEPGIPARSQVRWALTLRQKGYAVVLVSAPGWGRSRGKSDRSGTADIAAADAGIRTALQEPGIDPERIVVWGHGRGGTTALLAAMQHPRLAGVIAIDSPLDPAAEYAALKSDADRDEFIKNVGRKGVDWRPRSAVAQANRIAAPILVVQTDEALVTDPAPALEFAARRADSRLFVEVRVNGQEANPIRRRDGTRLALDFLTRRTGVRGK